jgi:hypothetical protein
MKMRAIFERGTPLAPARADEPRRRPHEFSRGLRDQHQ